MLLFKLLFAKTGRLRVTSLTSPHVGIKSLSLSRKVGAIPVKFISLGYFSDSTSIFPQIQSFLPTLIQLVLFKYTCKNVFPYIRSEVSLFCMQVENSAGHFSKLSLTIQTEKSKRI
jgi:hypothetical protein